MLLKIAFWILSFFFEYFYRTPVFPGAVGQPSIKLQHTSENRLPPNYLSFSRRKLSNYHMNDFCFINIAGELHVFMWKLTLKYCHYVKVNWPFEWVVHGWCFAEIPFRFTAAQLQTTSSQYKFSTNSTMTLLLLLKLFLSMSTNIP